MGKPPRCLGLDVGDRRIGVAVSDESGRLARPLTVLRRTGTAADAAGVAALARELGAGLVVVGLPLNMDGSRGEQAEKSLAFAAELSARGLRVELWDERLSTRQAQRVLVAAGARRRARRSREDAVAAALILQGFLERRRTAARSGEEADGSGRDGPGSP